MDVHTNRFGAFSCALDDNLMTATVNAIHLIVCFCAIVTLVQSERNLRRYLVRRKADKLVVVRYEVLGC
jgi:hypothetical protein